MSHRRYLSPGGSAKRARFGTRFAIAVRLFANRITFVWLTTLAVGAPCPAGELAISVVDRSGPEA